MAPKLEGVSIVKKAEVPSGIVATIIVPAYNEEAGVGFVLENLFRSVDGVCEVLVVDDGSNDATPTIASTFPCGVIRHRENRGKGEAIKTGLRHATGKYVIFIDADGTYPASHIPEMISVLHSHDAVYCSRRRGRANIPPLNRIGHAIFHNAIRCAYGFRGRDYCTGLYGMRKSYLDKMDIASQRFSVEPEIAIKASRMKLKIRDISIQYQPRKGKTKLCSYKAGWEHLKTIVSLLSWRLGPERQGLIEVIEGKVLPPEQQPGYTAERLSNLTRDDDCGVVTEGKASFVEDDALRSSGRSSEAGMERK